MNKFQQIYLDIEEKIRQGLYPINSLLPGENQLAQDYQVSRETIRRALKVLADHGYIHKQQGRGNTVLDFRQFSMPISGLVSYKEITQHQDLDVVTRVEVLEEVPAPQKILQATAIDPQETFIHIIRSRIIQGQVMILDEDYIRQAIVPQIPQQVAEDSLYAYFEDHLDLSIAYASKEFKAEKAGPLDIHYLGLDRGDYFISVESFVYLEDNRFFQYTHSHHLLDKFKFNDFARRRRA